jgi:hypothetical protein
MSNSLATIGRKARNTWETRRAFVAALAVPMVLGACSSPSAQMEAARADFPSRVENTRMMVQFDLIKSAGLSPEEREKKEASAAAVLMPSCVKPYTEQLQELVRAAADEARVTHSPPALDPLMSQAAALDAGFDRCAARFGVTGYNFIETADGKEHRVPEYLAWATEPLREYVAARGKAAAQQQAVALSLALLGAIAASSAVNPDQIRVQQYSRRDGTVVRSHMRTVPNETCLDNIRGCKN